MDTLVLHGVQALWIAFIVLGGVTTGYSIATTKQRYERAARRRRIHSA
ncbi:MAG TPA: hypothetical protein VGZ00_11555 [Candidatus Baltobacteraceae bacterium]|nr:hypothetical protein [Candidatus Baltobacteraceae bacterium]